MPISEDVVSGLKSRYSSIHPLIFHRSVERANSPGELFDILESIPSRYPIIWNEGNRRWTHTKDLVLVGRFELE